MHEAGPSNPLNAQLGLGLLQVSLEAEGNADVCNMKHRVISHAMDAITWLHQTLCSRTDSLSPPLNMSLTTTICSYVPTSLIVSVQDDATT